MKIYWARATFAAALSVSPIFTRTARASAPSSFAFTKAVQVVRRLRQSSAASTATSNLFSLNKLIDLELSQLNEIWRSEQTIEPVMFCWRAAWAPLLKRQTFCVLPRWARRQSESRGCDLVTRHRSESTWLQIVALRPKDFDLNLQINF